MVSQFMNTNNLSWRDLRQLVNDDFPGEIFFRHPFTVRGNRDVRKCGLFFKVVPDYLTTNCPQINRLTIFKMYKYGEISEYAYLIH